MAITPVQIDLWRQSPTEHQQLEFKEAKTQFDNQKLYQYCVAIANEGGGHLLLGIKDKAPREVVGTQAFSDPVGMEAKIFGALGFRVDIETVSHPDGRVLVFQIPSRPRGTAYDHEGKYLMRSGEQLLPMSEDQLRKIFSEGQPDWGEQVAIDGLTPDKVIELLDVQTFFELLGIPYPSDQHGVIERLQLERLIDPAGSNFSIRRITALLLARKISDFPLEMSRKAARVVVYNGKSKIHTKLERIGGRGYAVGF